ncbi:MAG: hypothetical protein GY711_03310 [bacterium]|nr:hypothetical protein [bacterium]
MRRLAIIALVLLVGIAATVAVLDDPTVPEQGAALTGGESVEARERAAPAMLEDGPAQERTSTDERVPVAPATSAHPPRGSYSTRQDWRLELELTYSGSERPPTTVTVTHPEMTDRSATFSYKREPDTSIDVSSLATGSVPDWLLVEVSGASEQPIVEKAMRVEDAAGHVEFRAAIDLGRWTRHLAGTVSLPAGLEYVPVVHLFDTDKRHLLSKKCEADGGFRFPLASGTRFYLCAVAPTLEPHTEVFELGSGANPLPCRIRLGAGASIEGVARSNGKPLAKGSNVFAERGDGVEPLLLDSQLGWSGEQLVRLGATTRMTEEGRFRIEGLSPGPHGLGAHARQVPMDGVNLVIGTRNQVALEVDAPATGVVLDLTSRVRTVTVEVRSEDGPLDGVRVQLERSEPDEGARGFRQRHGTSTGPEGRVRITFGTSHAYNLTVARSGYATHSAPLDPEGGETLVVVLERTGAVTDVLLRVDAGGSLFPRALVVRMMSLDHGPPLGRRVLGGPAGYLLTDVPPGEYDVDVFVDEPEGDETYLTSTSLILRVPDGGTHERTIELARGGFFTVRATGFESALQRPKWFVRNEQDRIVPGHLESGDEWQPGETERLRKPLPPGRYGLYLEARGFETWRGTVEIRAGETSAVEADLVEKR